MSVRAFLIEPTGEARLSLRRYTSARSGREYRDAMNEIGTASVTVDARRGGWHVDAARELPPKDDPRWPKVSDDGYVFQDEDEWQVFTDRLYRRVDSGELVTLRDAPEGAIYRADWYEDVPSLCGPDGRAYVAVCPGGGVWHIDGRASNCTLPNDTVHRCWVRHGEAPDFTVDENGVTCSAGAGSIQTHNWHGFLRGGVFVE